MHEQLSGLRGMCSKLFVTCINKETHVSYWAIPQGVWCSMASSTN